MAKNGDARSQVIIGVKYANGQGVPKDYKEAVKWYRLAADQGIDVAHNRLGMMYENGQGVLKNHIAAFALYKLAASVDPSSLDNNSTANLESLSASMTAEEIEAAEDLSRELNKPKNLLKALDQYLGSFDGLAASP